MSGFVERSRRAKRPRWSTPPGRADRRRRAALVDAADIDAWMSMAASADVDDVGDRRASTSTAMVGERGFRRGGLPAGRDSRSELKMQIRVIWALQR